MFLSLLHVNVSDDPDRPNPGRKWLGDIYRVHQRLWMAFPGKEQQAEDPFFLGRWDGPAIPEPKPKRRQAGFLFRIERDGDPRILVQSAQCPNWGYAFQNAPYLLATAPKVRQFNPAPERDETYRFRLVANVVRSKRVKYPDERTRTTRKGGYTVARKRRTEIRIHPMPLPDPLPTNPRERERLLCTRWEPWREWLNDVGEGRGFRVVDDETSPLLMETVYTYVRNHSKTPSSNPDEPMDRRYNAGLFNGVLVCTDAEKLRDALIDGIGPGKAFGFGLLSVAPVGRAP